MLLICATSILQAWAPSKDFLIHGPNSVHQTQKLYHSLFSYENSDQLGEETNGHAISTQISYLHYLLGRVPPELWRERESWPNILACFLGSIQVLYIQHGQPKYPGLYEKNLGQSSDSKCTGNAKQGPNPASIHIS